MRKRVVTDCLPRFGDIRSGCQRYAMGVNTFRKVAQDAGAIMRIGSRTYYDFDRLDVYFDTIIEAQNSKPTLQAVES